MIQPDEIRQKAERLYPSFLKAWLDGDATYFPRVIPSNKQLINGRVVQSAQEVQRLRNGSREVLGYGYTVEWKERRSREFGLNQFPVRVTFETQDDFLRFINKKLEFGHFEEAVASLRAESPALIDWVRTNRRLLIECAGELEGLLHVIRYFRDHPRPNQFARELPIPVDTKFIERHERVLREWFDIVLPPRAIHAGEAHFGRRYGLKFAEPHWLVRLLDPACRRHRGFPAASSRFPWRRWPVFSSRTRASSSSRIRPIYSRCRHSETPWLLAASDGRPSNCAKWSGCGPYRLCTGAIST